MPPYLAVHHPIDPALPEFDFWGWRLQRRFVADRLKALSDVEQAPAATTLRMLARALEVECFDGREMEALSAYLQAKGVRAPRDLPDLLVRLSELAQSQGAHPQTSWNLPIVRPDWDAIPLRRPIFIGKANGVRLRARLTTSRKLAPDYKVIWLERDEEEVQDVVKDRIGVNLPYGPAIWDWLFARRLTLLCLAGTGTWPDASRPPLLLNGEWQAPPRPF